MRKLCTILPGVMVFGVLLSVQSRCQAMSAIDTLAGQLTVPLAHEDAGAAGHGEEAERPQGGWDHFVRWVGHFHPPLTAFPIAMVLAAALAELLRLMRGPLWLDGASRWCMIVGGASAAITAPLGWAFAVEHHHSKLLEIHRWLGTAAGAGAVVLLIISEIARRRPGGAMVLFRTVLFLAVPLVIATGFFGGAMVYGLHEYDWQRPAVHESEESPEPTTHPTTAAAAKVVSMTADDTFKPDNLTIPAGTTVRWVNSSAHSHTVTDDPKVASDAKDVSRPNGAKPFNSGKVPPGGKFEHTFDVPGVYKYVCEPHEDMDMKGQITVEAGH